MSNQTDSQLLGAYATDRSETAFAELVRRYVDFTYSAALRMVRDPHLAQDVTQGVFLALARNASQLAARPVLSGWLHRTAQNIAAQTVRTIERRRAREQEAAAMNELLSDSSSASWQTIAPHLDRALGELNETDRDALLLRYFEKKSALEMAGVLGISDEAAQKRVNRAVERLRELFSKRNVSIGASGLAVLISANAVQAAPIELAATISGAALTGAAVTASTITITKTIAMTTLQKSLVAAAFTATAAILGGATLHEARQTAELRQQNQALQRDLAPLAGQIQQLQNERDAATNRLATMLARNLDAGPGSNELELLKLRGEVAQLRNSSQASARSKATSGQPGADPLETAAKDLLRKEELLKQWLEQMPEKNIPELQYLDTSVWARIAQNANLKTDAGVRQALSELRDIAKQIFAPQIGNALQEYVKANNGQLPTDASQLQPYMISTDPAILARYQMLKTGNVADLPKDEMLIAEKNSVDDEYDNLFEIGLNSRRSRGVGKNSGNTGSGSWSPPKDRSASN